MIAASRGSVFRDPSCEKLFATLNRTRGASAVEAVVGKIRRLRGPIIGAAAAGTAWRHISGTLSADRCVDRLVNQLAKAWDRPRSREVAEVIGRHLMTCQREMSALKAVKEAGTVVRLNSVGPRIRSDVEPTISVPAHQLIAAKFISPHVCEFVINPEGQP
jgi:hypothetical protein